MPGSSWGTFTIACTIPIALLTGLWMYRIRPGRVVEASLIGGTLTLVAVVAGNWIPSSPLERFFSLTRDQTIVTLGVYGFIAAVLPVWLLLGPRDYLSSFLKIGTVALLVVSVCVANPALQAPPVNEVFLNGGPTFPGSIFPFVFICIMCGAISGFHSLVSSGTTPKMIEKESQIRPIGYGAMLIEGLVGVVALIAAAALPSELYYAINVPIDQAPKYQNQLDEVYAKYGVNLPPEAKDPAHATNVDSPQHLDLGKVEEKVGGESLRGRTGGAVTLAVGMSVVFEQAFNMFGVTGEWLLKYWYHFAIMFEALFILTTIDAGTRIARFLFQETAGRVYAPFGRQDWLPGAILASGMVTGGWCWMVSNGSIMTIWPMFGIANQLLAVLALSLVTTWLVNHGRGRYAWVTILPMLFVCSTTLTAGVKVVLIDSGKNTTVGYLNASLTIFVITCVVHAAVLVRGAVADGVAQCGAVRLPTVLRSRRVEHDAARTRSDFARGSNRAGRNRTASPDDDRVDANRGARGFVRVPRRAAAVPRGARVAAADAPDPHAGALWRSRGRRGRRAWGTRFRPLPLQYGSTVPQDPTHERIAGPDGTMDPRCGSLDVAGNSGSTRKARGGESGATGGDPEVVPY